MSQAPSISPSLEPTTLTEKYSNTTWQDILNIFYYQLIFAGILWLFFELSRSHATNIYRPRSRWAPSKTPPKPPDRCLAWVPVVFRMKGSETSARVGLDAYMLLRFLRVCTRLTLFTSILGLAILVPIYGAGSEGFESFNKLTINNISGDRTLWWSTSLMVIFTAHAFYLLRHEYSNFVKWRVEYLARGTIEDVMFQARYTIRLDGIPDELKSSAMLTKFLSDVFPEQCFSVAIPFELSKLDSLHKKRMHVVDALERAVAYEHVTRKTRFVTLWGGADWPHQSFASTATCKRERVPAVPYFRRVLGVLNSSVQDIQQSLRQELREETAALSELHPVEFPISPERPLFEFASLNGEGRGADFSDGDEDASVSQDENDPTCCSKTGFVSNARDARFGAIEMLQITVTSLVSQVSHLASDAWSATRVAARRCNVELRAPTSIKRGDCAFATLTSEFAVTALCSGFLTTDASEIIATPAPEAEDIIWSNLVVSRQEQRTRSWLAGLTYLFLGIVWSAIVSLLSTIGTASGEALVIWGVNPTSVGYTIFMRYLPITLQLGVLALVPVCLQFTGTYLEGIQSNTGLQDVVFSRYFLFQIANIFVTIGSVSWFTFFQEYTANDIPMLLVDTFPKSGAYFIEFVLLKAMFGNAWELARAWPGLQMLVAQCCTDKRQWTKRALRRAYLSCPEILYGWIYPSALSVMVISFTYQVVTPLVCPFALGYFVIAEQVYKYNVLFVYHSKAESGGKLWNTAFNRLVAGLLFAHFLMGCFLFVKKAYYQVGVCVILVFADLLFAEYCHRVFERPSHVVPLAIAATKDKRDRHRGHVCRFASTMYEQHALRLGEVVEEPFAAAGSGPVFPTGRATQS